MVFGSPPTAGNLLVAVIACRASTSSSGWTAPSGWTKLDTAVDNVGNGGATALWYKTAGVSEPSSVSLTSDVNYKGSAMMEFSATPASAATTHLDAGSTASTQPIGPLVVAGPAVLVGAHIHGDPDNGPTYIEDTGWTAVYNAVMAGGFDPVLLASYRIVTGAGSYSHAPSQSTGAAYYGAILSAFETSGGGGGSPARSFVGGVIG